GVILQPALATAEQTLPPNAEPLLELKSILTAVSHLPPHTATDAESVAELAREKVIIRRRLSALYDGDAAMRAAIDAAVASFAGRRGEPSSWDALATLLDRQAYRLSFWRVATEEINYRRFFDVNSLAAL